MKRMWMTILLCSLPLAALGQPVPAGAGFRPAMAPNFPQHEAGITVNASGMVKTAATHAHIVLRLVSARNAPLYDSATVAPIVDAMVKSGVERNTIVLPLNFSAPGKSTFATISGDIEHPTTAMMQAAIPVVGSAIVAIPGAILQDAEVTLRSDDCGSTMQRARGKAIAQARAKAASLAQQIGETLGKVVSLTENDQLANGTSCTSMYSIAPYATMTMTEPKDYLSITVSSFVTVTYAIR